MKIVPSLFLMAWKNLDFNWAAYKNTPWIREILLRGNFNVIPGKSDFPVVDVGIPLMSKRMISIFEEDKTVSINKIDTLIVDDTYLQPLFDEKSKLINGLPTISDYQFLQVLNYTDAFDKTNSIFKPMCSNPDKVGIINKLVLTEPNNGFPAIFRIEEKPSILFINDASKNKLEEHRIKGYYLKEVETA